MRQVEPEALTLLSRQAMVDVAHLLRPAHLQQLSNILKDKEASENDKFVALEVVYFGHTHSTHTHTCMRAHARPTTHAHAHAHPPTHARTHARTHPPTHAHTHIHAHACAA